MRATVLSAVGTLELRLAAVQVANCGTLQRLAAAATATSWLTIRWAMEGLRQRFQRVLHLLLFMLMVEHLLEIIANSSESHECICARRTTRAHCVLQARGATSGRSNQTLVSGV